jgi:hypothetical protein
MAILGAGLNQLLCSFRGRGYIIFDVFLAIFCCLFRFAESDAQMSPNFNHVSRAVIKMFNLRLLYVQITCLSQALQDTDVCTDTNSVIDLRGSNAEDNPFTVAQPNGCPTHVIFTFTFTCASKIEFQLKYRFPQDESLHPKRSLFDYAGHL